MVKIIGYNIFVIVIVYYGEINAEADNLQSWFTTGFREDIRGPQKEYILRHGEPRYNDLTQHVAKKRRFIRSYRDDENKQIYEHDNDAKNPTKRKRHHQHSRKKKYKNHNSKRIKKTERYKNNMKEKDNEGKNIRHHYHLGRKMNKYVKTKRYKNITEEKPRIKSNEDETLNKEKEVNSKRSSNKNHNKDSEHPKKYKDKINKKIQAKDKQKDKNIDRHKQDITVSKSYDFADVNDHRHYQKPLISKSDEKKKEKSKHNIDKSKTAIGMAALGAAGAAALIEKSLASTKGPKPEQEHVLTSTTTSKPKTKPVQGQEVIKEKKLSKRERLNLRTNEKIRVTRIIPYSLQKEEDEANKKLRQGEGNKSSLAATPPSNLSPYAIATQMELLMKEFPEANATVLKFGRTVEYNDIVLVSITANKDEANFRAKESKFIDDVPEKKIIFIVHGLTVMGLRDMTSLVKSSELKILLSYYFKHLNNFDFFLMPLANPDGYSASLSPERAIWNKNVSPQSVCPGVFVDRNFDVAWNDTSKISSCSQLYPGASPFSEEESKAVRDVFHRYGHKILAYIHVHAGTFDEKVFKGDAILYPRGYTEMQSDDDKYIDIKGEVEEAMKNASFRVMSVTVDTLSNWYGLVGGTSVDYAATVYGIPYAMEFVMQLYDSETMNNDALTEIWSRLIDATFNKMWKSLQGGSDS